MENEHQTRDSITELRQITVSRLQLDRFKISLSAMLVVSLSFVGGQQRFSGLLFKISVALAFVALVSTAISFHLAAKISEKQFMDEENRIRPGSYVLPEASQFEYEQSLRRTRLTFVNQVGLWSAMLAVLLLFLHLVL